ncbi:MAG: putative restriction endonuclease [Nevskia sp.]|nr:putative restriction endonuclease [Nevskia sp.]
MLYLEMSRVETHGGGTWAFPNCIWSPSEKEGGGRWPFWEKVLAIREGDTVLHLRGTQPKAFFVGYSRASNNGFETSKRPPDAGAWSFSTNFHRSDLDNFTSFHSPISLTTVFSSRRAELEHYFDQNRARGPDRRNIFYVRQSGRLQCLNGAYLSDVDEELFEALFGVSAPTTVVREFSGATSIETGWQLATIRSRLGQAEFSKRIKELYGYRCCFPSCEIDDPRFLVGAHIARWSDNENLRGNLGNGLCLCVFHDKAFELGLFTIDEHYRVFVNPKETNRMSDVARNLLKSNGQPIALASIHPSDDALLEHWTRVDVSP